MIYLELVRSKVGAIVDIVPILQGTIHPNAGGYVQVLDGKLVADFEKRDILALPAEFDRDVVKEKAPPTAPIPDGLRMVGSWENALEGFDGCLGLKYLDGRWALNFYMIKDNPEVWLTPIWHKLRR